jgi:hypothetical protein
MRRRRRLHGSIGVPDGNATSSATGHGSMRFPHLHLFPNLVLPRI